MDKKIEKIKQHLRISAEVKQKTAEHSAAVISRAIDCIIDSLKSHGKVLICGNGGSAADSQHLAAELVGRFKKDRDTLPAVALTTDTSILTAVGNDYGFTHIFSRQVQALGRKGDILLGLSTSGRSENVSLAMKKAKEMGMHTIGLIGNNENCPIAEFSDIIISIPSPDTPFIQETHITIGHIMCDLIEDHFFKGDD